MTSTKFYSPAAIAVFAISLGIAAAPTSAQQGLARGHLYSNAAVNKICSTAQQIVATTNLEANNSIFNDWDGFVQGDAQPYSIVPFAPLPDYGPPEAPDLPLSSAQHIFYADYGQGNRSYPQVVSCKMKNADYLVKAGLDAQAQEQDCSAVNEYYVNEVIASLTNPEQASVVIEPDDEIVIGDQVDLDADEETFRGSEWTAGFPEAPYPVLYREYVGGDLHVKSRSLYVAANTETIDACNTMPDLQVFSFCTPRKWGVTYCHMPAPEYIRAALTGGVEVPIIPGGP